MVHLCVGLPTKTFNEHQQHFPTRFRFHFFIYLTSVVKMHTQIKNPFLHFPEKICITSGGASANKPCIFPFRFNGAVYSECTWDQAHLTEHKAWCSTLVDDTGHHVGGQGKWGNCGPGCPVPPDNRNKTKPGRMFYATGVFIL